MVSLRRSARLVGSKVGVDKSVQHSRRAAISQGSSSARGSSRTASRRQQLSCDVAAASKPASPAAPAAKRLKLGRTRENRKRGEGFAMVIGVDEAGRGPFAGPVVAAACHVPADLIIGGIQDSKKVAQHSHREALFKELTEAPGVIWATAEVGSRRIDEINILEATKEAMATCAQELCAKASEGTKPSVLIDGNFVPPGLSEVNAECVIGGDSTEYCIAAASIIAKVTRDRLMIEYGKRWPLFGFEKHKGYGTRAHHEALRQYGMVEIHRRSFLKKMEAAGGKLNEYPG
ncbi:unnamed protein product [Ascophyllum nodosum]